MVDLFQKYASRTRSNEIPYHKASCFYVVQASGAQPLQGRDSTYIKRNKISETCHMRNRKMSFQREQIEPDLVIKAETPTDYEPSQSTSGTPNPTIRAIETDDLHPNRRDSQRRRSQIPAQPQGPPRQLPIDICRISLSTLDPRATVSITARRISNEC